MKHPNLSVGEWLRWAVECCLLAASPDVVADLNVDALSAVADLAGWVGAVICLAYLARQFRHDPETE